MQKPDDIALGIAIKAGRKSLDDYSSFDSSMVPDAALTTFVTDVITAYINALPQPASGHKGESV